MESSKKFKEKTELELPHPSAGDFLFPSLYDILVKLCAAILSLDTSQTLNAF